MTNLYQFTSQSTTSIMPYNMGDRIVTIDYCDVVTLPYLYVSVLVD